MSNESRTLFLPAVLPDGNGGYEPCPELLTEAEAIRYLRLDTLQLENPSDTLRYYRNEKNLLKATKISHHLFYSRKALNEFLEKITNEKKPKK